MYVRSRQMHPYLQAAQLLVHLQQTITQLTVKTVYLAVAVAVAVVPGTVIVIVVAGTSLPD